MEQRKRFSIRGFTSFTLTLMFVVMALSGIVLYIVPPGRVAYWINWKLVGLTKENWAAVHTIFSYLFVIVALIHLYFNWTIFKGYLISRVEKGLRMKKELSAAIIITLAVFIGTLFELPPFGTTMDIGESLKESWEEGQPVAPAPHTELKTLEEVVEEFGMRLDRVLDKLERNGVKVTDTSKTLKDIAADNGISPSELYEIIGRRGDGSGQH